MKKPLLVTGSGGLIASRFLKDFASKYDIEPIDISHPQKPVDITNNSQVGEVFESSQSEFVLHFAAFTDVNKAWEQRQDKSGSAYKINVEGTENIVHAAASTGKHIIHISTAYVFDGAKDGLYTEEDELNPIEWYGYTKAKAEEVVKSSTIDWAILRIDQPFRSDQFPKQDIAHRIVTGLREGKLYPQFTDHFFGPTYINDLVKVIDEVIETRIKGLYHATSGEQWSDFEFATVIKETFGFETEVERGSLDEYLKTLSRPYQRNTALSSNKLQKLLKTELKPISEAIKELEF